MAIVKCPKCGKEISEHTHRCVHCGFVLNVLDCETIACPNCGTSASYYICRECNFDIGEYYFEKGCNLEEQGHSAFRSLVKEDESLRNLLISARLGYPDALNMLGVCYKNGVVVKKDEERGFEYLKKAALLDNSMAEFNLACCYELGVGTDVNYSEALKWYKKAARHHNEDAIFNIGLFYMQGYGVAIDYRQAIEWFSKLGKTDYEAQYNMGICFMNLDFAVQNFKDAESCFLNATKGNVLDAQEKLALVRYILRR